MVPDDDEAGDGGLPGAALPEVDASVEAPPPGAVFADDDPAGAGDVDEVPPDEAEAEDGLCAEPLWDGGSEVDVEPPEVADDGE